MAWFIRTAKLKAGEKLFPRHENTYRYELRQAAKRAGLPDFYHL
jgi:hypothetical protein